MATSATDRQPGQSIPAATSHAISVSLPTWHANVAYEEGQEWILNSMKGGYPRFFIHPSVVRLAQLVVDTCATPAERALLFPNAAIAHRCQLYMGSQQPELLARPRVRVLTLAEVLRQLGKPDGLAVADVAAVVFPDSDWQLAKSFWQHTGEGISSRRAEYCLRCIAGQEGSDTSLSRGGARSPKHVPDAALNVGPLAYSALARYRKVPSPPPRTLHLSTSPDKALPETDKASSDDNTCFIEERLGRNLDLSLADCAKAAIRRRIARCSAPTNTPENTPPRHRQTSEDDVYLYPSGMSAIYNTHRCMSAALGAGQSICYGFPYIDTLKLLEKFGPGCRFYGYGSEADLDDLENTQIAGEHYLALFCEFPGNPLLRTPNLQRIRALADKYNFLVVVDETIGNFLNVDVLPYADVIVSSLTKVFSGDSNVMGGSAVLNRQGPHYAELKRAWSNQYEDNLWVEDAIFIERNSRNFCKRNELINRNAEAVCRLLESSPIIKQLYYPKFDRTRSFYDICKKPDGGYGGLLSVTFRSQNAAEAFYDRLQIAKGPSLGTNFTLCSPYVVLAHYHELDWAAKFGVDANLVRISIGIEDTETLISVFREALDDPPKNMVE